MDHLLHCLNGLSLVNFESDGLVGGKRLDKNLNARGNKIQNGLIFNFKLSQCITVLQPFSCIGEALLIIWNSFFFLDLQLDNFDGVSWYKIESNRITGLTLDKNLHARRNKIKNGLILNAEVTQSQVVFKPVSSKSKTLLIKWNPLPCLEFAV